MQRVAYAIVVPVYNGADTLNELFERTKQTMASIDASFRMVFVDDCSKDGSWDNIKTLKKKYPTQVTAIKLARNSGQHNATLCGLHHCNADFVVTIDDDLQIPPEEIPKLIARQKETEADLVYGVFDAKKHAPIRNAGSWFVNKFFYYFANTSGNGSSFRLVSSNLAERLRNVNQKYLLLDEVLSWYTSGVSNVNVEHLQRAKGRSGYSALKLMLLTFNYIINYTVLPLRLMTYLGIFGSIICLILSVIYVYQKLSYDVELGFTSLIVAIFFSTSLILFCLGIIGEYISRLYVKDGSTYYVIKEIR
jgi:undecaprenyl-phosphate 4-deoxy-4-formamido-L-arabinose transferase